MKRIRRHNRYREQADSAPDCARGPEPLVLGYHGTLMPDPAGSSSAGGAVECNLGIAVEPWLENAARELALRLSAERTGGEAVDHGALIDSLKGRLTGMLAQAMMACPDATAEQVVREFPVLAGLMKVAVTEWADAITVFHQRLRSDASRLATWLGYKELPCVESLTAAGSDHHSGAHTAMRVLFQGGRNIYYKPRPVTGEWLWDRLVQEVNPHLSSPLASARALGGANGRYGWIESLLPHGQLQNLDKASAQAATYWQAAGATLCLAEHMRMTDLHMANMMATSRGPALLDGESLGTPRATLATPTRAEARQPFAETLSDLLDTGLLPVENPSGLPETSGLLGKSAAVAQILIPSWSKDRDGRSRLAMTPAVLVDHRNAPPHGSPIEMLPLLVSGYREAASALMRCRESLISAGSEWRRTLEHQHAPRIILRDTLTYSILISRSLQPKQLQHAKHRAAALRNALRYFGPGDFPHAILRTEARALGGLHIPRFIGLPGTRTLAGTSGRALAPDFLSCSPCVAVLRKLGELTPNRLSEVQIPGLLQAVLRRMG